MEMIELLFCLIIVAIVVTVILICISDGDLTLMYHAKFGNKLNDLRGKVIWITGASTGIGAALAEQAAGCGAHLILSARSEEKLQEVKKKCLETGSSVGLKDENILVLRMDMCEVDKHEDHVKTVIEHFGKIDIVIQNAGRSQRARWEHTDLKVDKDMFDLNVFSVVNLTRAIIPHFLEQGGGTFALMSSVAGLMGVPLSPSYTGSKHALQGYFKSLRMEKVGTGINVTFLCPGPVFSNILEHASTEKANQSLQGKMTETDRRMETSRCAFLSLVAIAHKLDEAWITFFPILPMVYVNQYAPATFNRIQSLMSPDVISKLREGKNKSKNA